MGAIRATAAAVLILFTAVAAMGECVTAAQPHLHAPVASRTSSPDRSPGAAASSASPRPRKTPPPRSGSPSTTKPCRPSSPTASSRTTRATSSVSNGRARSSGSSTARPNQRLHLQRLTMMGDPIGGPIPITPGRTVYAGDEIEIEWSAAVDAYVVARNISQGQFEGIWVTYVTRDGTHRSDRRLSVLAASQSNLSLSVTNAGVAGLVFANQGDAISLVRITETASPISITVAPTAGNFIETAAVGNQFVITHAVVERREVEGPLADRRYVAPGPPAR